MKVSIKWLSDYFGPGLPPVDQLVEKIGSQLGAVEEVSDIGAKYQGATVVRVVECSPLEGSDHLSLCFIDDKGVVKDVDRREDGLVQVVCGAPNVEAGITVVWLPPGVTVPSTHDTEPFVLEARELRGTVSNGMLASAKELAIGDSHEGLWVLNPLDAEPGTSLIKAYWLDDHIIDIENKMFTHRPDCFGMLGVAREVAGILGQPFVSPEWYTKSATVPSDQGASIKTVSVTNEIPELCPRYMAVAIDNIKVEPSPVWLQTYLSRVGLRPINNIVDMTNYVMLATGQPLHAFDYDKVAQNGEANLVIRKPHKGEELTLLDGKTITPRADAILIATPDKAIALGGVMGGGNSEIDANTKRIIIECANFDMFNIRRTSMQHGLFTDAVSRFNKGQSEWQCQAVLAQAVSLLKQWYPDTIAVGETVDYHQPLKENKSITVSRDFINQRLGLTLTSQEMATLLTNVEFTVSVSDDGLEVLAPFWRTDIEIPEDVVEEIGRLHGFDKLPLELPKRDITPAAQDALQLTKTHIRGSLAKAGANELLTYSFVHGNLIDKAGQNREQAYKVSNALSPDLQYYRLTALPSLLDKVHANIKAGYDQFALFELGKGHDKSVKLTEEGVPREFEDLDFVYASKTAQTGAAFYHARAYLDALAADLGLQLEYRAADASLKDPVLDPYDLNRSAQVSLVGGTDIGVVGEFKASVRKNYKLPDYSAGFTISPSSLTAAKPAKTYAPLPRYPKIEQDICLRVSADLPFTELAAFVAETLESLKPAETRLNLSPLDIFQREANDQHKQITFRVAMASFEKTMTDQEMSGLLDELSQKAAERFNAERV